MSVELHRDSIPVRTSTRTGQFTFLLLGCLLSLFPGAHAAAQENSPKPQDFIQLENRMGQQFMVGEYAAAAETCLQAVKVFQQLVPNDDGQMKGRTTVFAPILAYGGRSDEAMAMAERYVTTSEELLGPQHFSSHDARMLRDMVKSIVQLPKEDIVRLADAERDSRRSELLLKEQKFDEAVQLQSHALKVRSDLLGTSNPMHVVDLMKLSFAMRLADEKAGRQDSKEPLQVMEKALATISGLVPEDECPGGHPLVAQAAETLGEIAKRLEQFDRSRSAYSTALAVQKKLYPETQHPKGHEKIVDAMIGISYSLIKLESFDAALSVIREGTAMTIRLNPRGDENTATFHLFEAQIAMARANYGQARKSAITALGLFQNAAGEEPTQDDLYKQVSALRIMIAVEYHQGNNENAEIFAHHAVQGLEQAFPIDKYPQGHFELAKGLVDFGTVESRLAKYDEAEQFFSRATDMYRQLLKENAIPMREAAFAEALGSYALCKYRQNKLDAAISLFREDIQILERLQSTHSSRKIKQELSRALLHLGGALQLSGEPVEEWYPSLERAVELARELFPSERFPQGHPFQMIALRNLVRGKAIAEDHPEGISLLVELIDLHYRYVAHEMLRTNVDSLREELNLLEIELDWLLTYAYVLRDEAPTYTEMTYRWFAAQKSIVVDTLIRVRHQQRELKEDEDLAELVEAVEHAQANSRVLALTPPDYLTPEKLEEERREQSFKLEMLENNLMLALTERTETIPSGRISLDDVCRQLKQRGGEVLIDIVRMNPLDLNAKEVGNLRRIPTHYIAFVIDPDAKHPVQLVDLGRSDDIDPLIADLRKHIRDVPRSLRISSEEQLVETYKELALPIYEAVVAPLAESLIGVEKVFIAPDGELNRIAFEALVDKQGRFLIENYTFAYLSSASDLLREAVEPGSGAVIFANPDYNLGLEAREVTLEELRKLEERTSELAMRSIPQELTRGLNWDSLPSSSKEASLVAELLKDSNYGEVATFVESQALEDYMKRLKQPRLLHLATHGFYLPQVEDNEEELELVSEDGAPLASQLLARLGREANPLVRSGLVLAGANVVSQKDTYGLHGGADDGWVTAEEVAMLDLRGTELVVLSACETGLADIRNGENVSGLRRAFMHAGAANLVTSLYKVPDEATQKLMVKFYTNLRDSPPMTALREAELSYLKERRESEGAAHPFFWGSFIFVGAP